MVGLVMNQLQLDTTAFVGLLPDCYARHQIKLRNPSLETQRPTSRHGRYVLVHRVSCGVRDPRGQLAHRPLTPVCEEIPNCSELCKRGGRQANTS